MIEVESGAIHYPAAADIIRHVLSPFNAQLAAVVGETAAALNSAAVPETSNNKFIIVY